MARQSKPKGMSEKTYTLLSDMSFTHEEIEFIWRLFFNDICASYDVSPKRAPTSIKKTKTSKKKTAKKPAKKKTTSSKSYFDGKEWHGDEPDNVAWWPSHTRATIEIGGSEDKKEKDQIPVSSLIKDEAKKIEVESNAARRKSLIEGVRGRQPEEEEQEEPQRKAKTKRRGAW